MHFVTVDQVSLHKHMHLHLKRNYMTRERFDKIMHGQYELLDIKKHCCGISYDTMVNIFVLLLSWPPHCHHETCRLITTLTLRTTRNHSSAAFLRTVCTTQTLQVYRATNRSVLDYGCEAIFKMKKRGDTTPYEKVESLLPADLLGDIEEETPTIPPWRLRKPVIDTSNLSFAADNPMRMLVARERIENLQECLVCYTDASKTMDNKAGLGIYIPKKNVNISLRTSSHSCISSIELPAIEDCLIHVKDSYQGETFDIVILSDSLSTLEALRDCNHFDRNINKTLTIISELQKSGRKVTLVWVPAHVGIPGNEKADALAKAATTREQIDRWIPASI